MTVAEQRTHALFPALVKNLGRKADALERIAAGLPGSAEVPSSADSNKEKGGAP